MDVRYVVWFWAGDLYLFRVFRLLFGLWWFELVGSSGLLVAWFMVLAIIGFWVGSVGLLVCVFGFGLWFGVLLGLVQYTSAGLLNVWWVSGSCCSSC